MSELDTQVAEKVMRLDVWAEKRGEYTAAVTRRQDGREPWMGSRDSEDRKSRYKKITCAEAVAMGFFGEGIPRYSADISAAFQVVEKMRERGWKFKLWEAMGSWRAIFLKTGYSDDFESVDLSAPVVICKAALKAIEAQ